MEEKEIIAKDFSDISKSIDQLALKIISKEDNIHNISDISKKFSKAKRLLGSLSDKYNELPF